MYVYMTFDKYYIYTISHSSKIINSELEDIALTIHTTMFWITI